MADRTVSVRITGDASGLLSALGRAQTGVSQLAQSMGRASQSQSWSTVSTGLLGVGAAATAAAGTAIKMAADFDESMSKVAATGDDARANIGQLRELAIDMGAKTKYSATEAATGIEVLAKAGMSTADIIGGGLSGALALAATDNMSLENAAEATATALTQFGLAGNQAGHVADLLAAGAGKAMGSVQDMSDALKNGGLVASNMGMSLEETVGTLALFAQNGIVGAEAGTQLKVMLQKLQNPSSTAKKAMDELGISAYDAGGKFVGMANLAQQLRDKTAGLSQAQRDQAMAAIFGSHAISAATVLYKAGAQGVQEWTNAVNDQGYAERAASEKMNNLKGDLEQLKGAWETLMISAGEGSQGPLRGMVQALTGVVDALNEHPKAAQAAVVALGAVGAAATAAGVAMKGITAISSFRDAMQSLTGLSGAMDTVRTGASWLKAAWDGTSTSMKVSTAASVALAAAVTAAGQALSQHIADTSKISGAMDSLAAGSISAADAIGQVNEKASGAYLSLGGPSGLAQAMMDVANPGPLEGIMSFVGGLVGMKTTTETAKGELEALDQGLAKLVQSGSAQAGPAMEQVGQYIREAGLSADQVVGQFGQTADALRQEAEAAGLAGISNQTLANWMSTGIKPAAVAAAEAAGQAGEKQRQLGEDAEAAGASVEDYASTLQSASDALNELGNAAISSSDAQIKVQQAMEQAAQAAAQNGQGLDIATKAGRDNQSALNDLASAALKAREAMVANGDGLDEINATTQQARDSFIQAAEAMGASADEAAGMADKYGLGAMSVQEFEQASKDAGQAAQEAAGQVGGLGDTAVNAGQNVAGTADNFEYMGRKAGIAAEDMYRLAQANQEGAAALDTVAQQALAQRDALTQAGASQQTIADTTNNARDAFIQQAQAMGMSAEQAGALADAYGLTSVQLDMSASSVQNATTAMQNNAAVAGLDQGAVAGLAQSHQDGVVALQAYADQSRNAAAALDAGSMSADQAASAQQNARQSFVDCAVQMGLTQDEANRLADAYGLIPGDVQTKVSAPGATQAKSDADADHQAVDAIPNQKHTNVSTSADTGPLHAVKSLLDSIVSKTVTVSVFEQHFSSGVDRALHKAAGGYISGPGTATSDSIPAWLSAGEYVIRAAAVRRYGRTLFDRLNAGVADGWHAAGGPGFARGGYVQQPRYVTMPAPAAGGQTVINVEPAVITEGQLDRYLTRSVESVTARVLTGALGRGV